MEGSEWHGQCMELQSPPSNKTELLPALSECRRFFLCSLPLVSLLSLSCLFSEPLSAFYLLNSKTSTMDLIGWSLNTFDNIFSTQRQGAGAASCPPCLPSPHVSSYRVSFVELWCAVLRLLLSPHSVCSVCYVYFSCLYVWILDGCVVSRWTEKVQ